MDGARAALAAAHTAHAGISRLALVGINNNGASNDNDEANSVGGSDTDLPSGPDNDSSDYDRDSSDDSNGAASDAESANVLAAGSDADRTAVKDASDVEIESLGTLLERYRLKNQTLRSELEVATRTDGGRQASLAQLGNE